MTLALPTSSSPRVSILIVTARHGEHLRACLCALARNVAGELEWEAAGDAPDVEDAPGVPDPPQHERVFDDALVDEALDIGHLLGRERGAAEVER